MPVDARHQWVANEEIDGPVLLDAMGGKALYYEAASTDNLFGTAEQNLLSVAIAVGTPRMLLMLASGTVNILDDTGVAQLWFTAAVPGSSSSSHVGPAITWRGYEDAHGTARLAGSVASFAIYAATPVGTHTLHLAGANAGAGGTNCSISSGFRFMVVDLGKAF